MILSNDSLVAFHYRSYGTFFLHKNRLHNIYRGFTHYKYYRAAFLSNLLILKNYNKEFLKSKSFYPRLLSFCLRLSHLPLKEALVLLATIPKGILLFLNTQFIDCYIILYSFSNFHTREEIILQIISLIQRIFFNCSFIKFHRTYIITFCPEMSIFKLVLEVGVFVKHHELDFTF